MFPIRNPGQIIAFGGRAMGDAQPKYLNSPQTLLFDKSSVLYGMDLARDAIRQLDNVVIVEGYIDVIALHQHGFQNVVAPLGTALTVSMYSPSKNSPEKSTSHLMRTVRGFVRRSRAPDIERTHGQPAVPPPHTSRGLAMESKHGC
jgi:hypothetical protein